MAGGSSSASHIHGAPRQGKLWLLLVVCGNQGAAKGAHMPWGILSMHSAHVEGQREWGLRIESRGDPSSICKVRRDTELVAKSWTWIFHPIPMAAVGCHCIQTTALLSRWPPDKI